MSKLSKETKKTICETLGISIDTDDDKVVEYYIEYIDNEPIGHTDRMFVRSNAQCSFVSTIDKKIDEIIKHHRLKKLKQHKKSNNEEDCLSL